VSAGAAPIVKLCDEVVVPAGVTTVMGPVVV